MFEEYGVIKTIKIVRDQSKPNDVVGLIRYPNTKGGKRGEKEKKRENREKQDVRR